MIRHPLLLGLGVVALAFVAYALVYSVIDQYRIRSWEAAGYYVRDIRPDHIAAIAVQLHRPRECYKIKQLHESMGPTESELRLMCIYETAQLLKDPTVCELLMPSSYGLSCVGGARSSSDICSMDSDSVAWSTGRAKYSTCHKDETSRSLQGNQCCLIARASFVKGENDCTSLKEYRDLFDECQFSVSFKNHDPSSCETISDPNLKSACIVSAKAMQKDPAICSYCKQPVDRIEDLK